MKCGLGAIGWGQLVVALALASIAATLAAAPVLPSFSIDNATAAEDSGAITFRVRKHGRLNNQPSILNLYGVDGSAKFPWDFDSMNQSVTFAPAETVKMVTIHLVNDKVPEPTETFTAKIRAVSNARLYDGTAIGTITDNDVAPPPPPLPEWVPAPLSDASGYVRTKTACTAWGEGQTRNPAAREVFKIITSTQVPLGGTLSNLGYSADNRAILAVMPLNGETRALYLYLDCLEGVKPGR